MSEPDKKSPADKTPPSQEKCSDTPELKKLSDAPNPQKVSLSGNNFLSQLKSILENFRSTLKSREDFYLHSLL